MKHATPPVRTTELIDRLQDVSRRIVGLTAEALASIEKSSEGRDVSLPQYRVLVILAMRNEATPSTLADDLGVTRPAITRILRTLQLRWLITRRADEHDRRQVWIAPTANGLAIVDAVAAYRKHRFASAVRRLSPPQRAVLTEAISHLLATLEPPASS